MADIREQDLDLKTAISDTDWIRLVTPTGNHRMTVGQFKDLIGYTQAKSDISQLQTDVASLVDSGSNPSGKYVRFSDGTQICWINWSLGSITIDSMSVSPTYSWSFPSSFIENPSVQISNSSTNSNWIRSNFITVTPTIVNGVQLFNTFTNSITNNHTLYVLAIGRWK